MVRATFSPASEITTRAVSFFSLLITEVQYRVELSVFFLLFFRYKGTDSPPKKEILSKL